MSRPENRRSVSVGATGGVTVTERHSYAEGRVPAPHGLPPSPGAVAAQRRVAAACQASRRLLEETLAKGGQYFVLTVPTKFYITFLPRPILRNEIKVRTFENELH